MIKLQKQVWRCQQPSCKKGQEASSKQENEQLQWWVSGIFKL